MGETRTCRPDTYGNFITARAHELGRTRHGVVISYYDDRHGEGQATVVTETKGPLAGKRVVGI